MAALIIISVILLCLLVWGGIRLMIWIIKTAIKEALQEYDAEKRSNYGSQ